MNDGVFVFVGAMGALLSLIGFVIWLRRETHCCECGLPREQAVWHCDHGAKESS